MSQIAISRLHLLSCGTLSAGRTIDDPVQSLLIESREEIQGDLPITGITQPKGAMTSKAMLELVRED
jgi:hypothetical protein